MKKIRSELEKRYLSKIEHSKKHLFKKWIINLTTGKIDSKRLACCIAIDTKYNLVSIDKYINIFNELDYSSKVSSNMIFENAILANNSLHQFSNTHSSDFVRYAKVLTIEDFIQFYLDPEGYYFTIHDKPKVKEEILRGSFDEITLSSNSGPPPRNIGWIVPQDVIEACIKYSKKNNLNIADQVIDRLGLDRDFIGTLKDTHPEYVYIIYPPNFKEKTWQPNAINAGWHSNEGLFVSYKNHDLHGRTRPLTGDRVTRRCQERIHKGIDGKGYKYSIKYLGKTSSGVKKIKSIVNNSKQRFDGK